jgi:hypothetical protein
LPLGIRNNVANFLVGATAVGVYTVGAAILVHKLITWTPFNRKIFQRMSLVQYVILQVFLITMLSLPVKMILRLMFRVKYVWVTPWFNI